MKLKSVLSGLAIAVAASSAQSAAVIEMEGGSAGYLAGIESAFLSSLTASTTETFDTWSTTGAVYSGGQQNEWIDTAATLSTSVGDFTLMTPGQASGNALNDQLMIESSETGEYGREILASSTSDFWLDSNDAKSVDWTVSADASYNAIGFYLADINDVGAKIKLSFANGTTDTFQVTTGLSNASLFYTTIISDIGITGATLTFDNCVSNSNCSDLDPDDGWGIDDITVGQHVPEPATIALMGLGLAGLGFARRRKA